MRAGVAAGHPATCEAGLEVLEDGGSAADAAVAAALASCVAETVMTGLLGGGHAIHWDAARGVVENLDCFVAVPTGSGAEPVELAVPFGTELVHYAVGPASFGVPGVPAGLGVLWRARGRLPWARLFEPALRLAAQGVPMPPAHVRCLEMLAPVLTMHEGERIYSPGGPLLREGERLQQPGLVRALELLRDEGPASAYTGTIADAVVGLCEERGGLVTRDDLERYEPRWSDPVRVRYAGTEFCTRPGLSHVPETLARLGPARRNPVRTLLTALDQHEGPETHTTNLVAVDGDGNACVLTTSLGLGSGDYVPGLDLHLNSMLGEADLVRSELVPGKRMESMMAPSIALDETGPVLAIGAAGGTRLRTALVAVTAAILDEGVEPQAAVERPRFHPVGRLLNAEPGLPPETLEALAREGWSVRVWPDRHHYFGGVSAIGRTGSAADPRRSGAAAELGRDP